MFTWMITSLRLRHLFAASGHGQFAHHPCENITPCQLAGDKNILGFLGFLGSIDIDTSLRHPFVIEGAAAIVRRTVAVFRSLTGPIYCSVARCWGGHGCSR